MRGDKLALTRRIWCETLSFSELLEGDALRVPAERGWSLLLAVLPGDLPHIPELLLRAESLGLPVSLWPMLTSDRGRWVHATTLEPFLALAEQILVQCEARGRLPAELVVDLEPPFQMVADMVSDLVTPGFGSPWQHAKHLLRVTREGAIRFDRAHERLARFVEASHRRGVPVSCTALPLVPLDDGQRAWQRLLGTPVDGVGFRRVNIMMYSSLVEGWSKGVLDRTRSMRALQEVAQLTVAKYGEGASLSLGLVGTGAFSNEPVYRSPSELREDVAIARAAGVRDLCLFDLGGATRRPHTRAWLDAFANDDAHAPAFAPAPRSVEALRWISRIATSSVRFFGSP